MGHKFNPAQMKKLDSPMRRQLLPPEEIIYKLGIRPGQSVADLGCGIGYFSFPLADVVGPEGYVYGVDISPEMLQECRRRWRDEHQEKQNISFLLSLENSLPLANEQVDACLLCTVLHELPQPELFLGEVRRILRAQSCIKIIEWKKEAMEMGPPVGERLSVAETAHLLEGCQFKVLEEIDLGKGHYAVIARRD